MDFSVTKPVEENAGKLVKITGKLVWFVKSRVSASFRHSKIKTNKKINLNNLGTKIYYLQSFIFKQLEDHGRHR